MKDGVKDIVGKTIEAVVVARNDRDPLNQVFLVFEDGTYFEFWGPNFSCAGGIVQGGKEKVTSYIQKLGGRITGIYPKSS